MPETKSTKATKPASPTRRSLAGDFFICLETASQVVAQFKERHNRPPSEIEMRTAAELFGELQRSNGKRALLSTREGGES